MWEIHTPRQGNEHWSSEGACRVKCDYRRRHHHEVSVDCRSFSEFDRAMLAVDDESRENDRGA
jgi:hypothetical protein